MGILDITMETKNNLGDGLGKAVHRIDPGNRPMAEPAEIDVEVDAAPEDPVAAATGMTEAEIHNLMRSAYRQGLDYQQQTLQGRWAGAYNAWNNKHQGDSKYNQARYRGRTKLFRPKTRATARKKSAEAAAALFSTAGVVIVGAANEADDMQAASAAIVQELINYRLDRGSAAAGIPWFAIAMGAHHTAQMTAICVSKQYWEYRTEERMEEVDEPVHIPPALATAFPHLQQLGLTHKVMKATTRIVRDKPVIRLYPPENVIRDPAASWEDQAQDSSYVILQNPMSVADARQFLKNTNERSPVRFIDVRDVDLYGAAGVATGDAGTAATTRRARDQSGNDRYADQSVDNEYKTVWLHENFMRINGKEFVFWSLGDTKIVSNIVAVEDAYPERGGLRPVVIGVGSLEPFKIDPMAPVAAWQPLQQEINDVVNLRLDTMKQSIAPLTVVRRGRSVDIKAIQNRSPDSVAYVQDIDDVKFDRPGDVGQSAYVEMERLNADFDDQAGNFSLGSVQTNRSLNETVGGMNLMNGTANAMGEFDLRVWIETWVEPVLRQLVQLEQYWESDTTVIAVAAQKAKLFQKFGISQVGDDLLTAQVTITVNVGLGAADPMLSLQKLAAATQVAGNLIGPAMAERVKADAIIDEVFGKAGYKDATERFFNPAAEDDPRLMQAQQALQQMQGQMQEMDRQVKDKSAERKNKLDIARLNTLAGLASKQMDHRRAAQGDVVNAMMTERQRQHDVEQGDRQFERTQEMHQSQQPPLPVEGGDGQNIQQMLGLQPDNSAVEALATGMQQQTVAFAQGMRSMMAAFTQAMQQIVQAQEQSNANLAAAIQQGDAQVINAIARTGAQQAAASQQIAAAIAAPKTIQRGADGFATAVVTRPAQ